jgi:hypothetical protein
MSVADLMIAFTTRQSFLHIHQWINHTFGYCFHSDHTLAYFVNFYYISVPTTKLPPFPDRRRRRRTSSVSNATTTTEEEHHEQTKRDQFLEQLRLQHPILSIDPCHSTECSHRGYQKCQLQPSSSSTTTKNRPRICHNIEPQDMELLYQQDLQS